MRAKYVPIFPLVVLLATQSPAFPSFHMGKGKPGATATLHTSDGKDAGTATFQQKGADAVSIKLKLENLPPGEHGVHIHAKGVCDAPDFKSSGGHFNPAGKQHGYANPGGHHNGDLPQNVNVGADGKGSASFLVHDLSLAPDAMDSLLANGGTSLMVHAKADDMKTDPSGNSGDRIACGVIAKP